METEVTKGMMVANVIKVTLETKGSMITYINMGTIGTNMDIAF